MFIGTLVKAPSELSHMGIDYSRWLGSSQVVSLEATITKEFGDTDPTPVRLWAVFVSPDGKSVHVFVERGSIDADYSVVLVATAASRLVREDDLLVRLEVPV